MTNILVIEDEKPLLDEILDILRFEGYEPEGAGDGLTGLRLARELMPQLIISDIMMPEMDGYEVLQELRNDLSTAAIPFIFLSARTDQSDRRRGMELGADDYLTKPVTNSDLLSAIKSRLAKQSAAEMRRLRTYSHRLTALQEVERRKIADTLQNEVGRIIEGLQVTLEMSKHMAPDMRQSVFDEVDIMVDQLSTTVNEVSLSLWPAPLDHLGLLPALFWQFERYMRNTGVKVNFQHQGLEKSFDPDVKAAVFRIIQEALANAAEHAQVDNVVVQIWIEYDTVNIQIGDAGVGFRLEETYTSENAIGLTQMYERALALGGDLTIMSAPHKGTHIRAQIPLSGVDRFRPESLFREASRFMFGGDNERYRSQSRHQQADSNLNAGSVPANMAELHDVISIVLADDNEITRRGLHSLLDTHDEFSIIGEVVEGKEVVNVVKQLNPDVLVLNLVMSDFGGLEITEQVVREALQTRVLILSSYSEDAYFLEAFRRGATGYIHKNTNVENLTHAVREVAANRRYLSQSLSDRDIESYANLQGVEKDANLDAYGTLTNREREVLHLVLGGHSNAEIADQLVISPRTAETHRANMMRKIGVSNYRELLQYALRRGMIKADD